MDHYQSEIAFQNLPKSLSSARLQKLLRMLVTDEQKRLGRLMYVFVPREKIISINQNYLNHNYSTDIITFDYVEGDLISGEIFICDVEVIDNAVRYGVSSEDEFVRVCVHGLLHLVGYSDGTEEAKMVMRGMEDRYLYEWNKLKNGEV